MGEREERIVRALDYLADLGLDRGPWEGDFPTYSAWYRAWAEYIHARAMAGYRFHQLEREAQERAEQEQREAERPTPRRSAGTPTEPRAYLSQTHNAVGLTEDAVRAIRRRRAEGEDRKALAAEFGVTPAMVGMIHHRRRHAHVPD